MKFAITAAARDDYYMIKEFNTIEELIAFYKKAKNEIIIGHNECYKEKNLAFVHEYNPNVDAKELTNIPYAITIYDDYME